MGISQREGKPHFGSVISRMQGPVDPVMPPFVDLSPVMQHRPYNTPGPGILSQAYRAARMEGEDLALLRPPAGVSATDRFADRQNLLDQFDQFRRSVESSFTRWDEQLLPPGVHRADLGQAGQSA